MQYDNALSGSTSESRLAIRSADCVLEPSFVAFIGSTETYGRFVDKPFAAQLGESLGVQAVNMGCVNAGIDAFLKDEVLLDYSTHAKAVVLQVFSAHTLSNRFFTVHPRRNDRFVRASETLIALYPELDFSRYNFVNHLLDDMREASAERFEKVRTELAEAWVGRMRRVIAEIRRPVILLWLSPHAPGDHGVEACGICPRYVTRQMLDQLKDLTADQVMVEAKSDTTEGMVFDPAEAEVARATLGVSAHAAAARALYEPLVRVLGTTEKRAPQDAPSNFAF